MQLPVPVLTWLTRYVSGKDQQNSVSSLRTCCSTVPERCTSRTPPQRRKLRFQHMTAITSSPLFGRQEGSRKSWNRRNHRAGSDGDFGEGGIAGHAMGPKSNDVGHMNKQQFFRGSNNAKNWDGSEGAQERPTLEAKLAFGSVMKITGAQATREPRLGQGQSLPSST